MTDEQVQECKQIYQRVMSYNIGNPDKGGQWYTYESYIDYDDREYVLFWECFIWELKQYKLPYTLPKAVKYVVMSGFPQKFEYVFKLIHWLQNHPEYV